MSTSSPTIPGPGSSLPIAPDADAHHSYGPLHPVAVWRRLKRDKPAIFGGFLVVVVILIAAFAPWLAPYDPRAGDRALQNEAPFWLGDGTGQSHAENHYMGRDVRGQDILSRVLYGARTSLLVGVAVVTIAGIIGVSLGCVAGYAGGLVDALVMRFVDILLAFPFLILALAVVSIFPRTTTFHLAIVLGLASWPGICRLMRGQVMATRENDYVKAARALGAGHWMILFRHILPNCIAPVVIWFTMGIAGAIMGEASLSFLGLGDDDSLSWGTMINNGISKADMTVQWWVVVFPSVALAITVLGFNLLGDGLQDAINPRLKK